MTTVIRAGWLLDGTGARPVKDGYVVYSNGRIVDVGLIEHLALPPDATVIDLPGHTLLPGLIDVHSHASIHTLGHEAAQVARREADITIDALHWLKQDLASGVTTMRTLGDPDFLDIRLRQAQRDGKIEGPRLYVAGNLVQSSHVSVSVSRATCDGPDAIRQAVRASVRAGCDWVKFYSTPASRAHDPILAIFSQAEVNVIFEEARRAGRPVSVHCHGGAAADWCIAHKVDSLEHGLFLDRRQMADMAKHGITLVPTTGVILLQEAAPPSPELARAQERARTYLVMAREEGVNCVPGTDAVHGRLAFELEVLVSCGWAVTDAVACVTERAAKLLHSADGLGSLSVGKVADIIAVSGNVADDITLLRNVDLVVQSGRTKIDSERRP